MVYYYYEALLLRMHHSHWLKWQVTTFSPVNRVWRILLYFTVQLSPVFVQPQLALCIFLYCIICKYGCGMYKTYRYGVYYLFIPFATVKKIETVKNVTFCPHRSDGQVVSGTDCSVSEPYMDAGFQCSGRSLHYPLSMMPSLDRLSSSLSSIR